MLYIVKLNKIIIIIFTDIDECALGTHNFDRAGPQYQCVNIPGSFRCTKRVTTTVAPAPEVEYEYYDSE